MKTTKQRPTNYDEAYEAYVRKYNKNIDIGMRNGMKPIKVLAMQESMLTKDQFEDNIRIMKAEIRAEGRRASSATKLGEKLANQQTTVKSEAQVRELREAYKRARDEGVYTGKVPTTAQLRYGEHQAFFDAIRKHTKDLGIDFGDYVTETIFGSP